MLCLSRTSVCDNISVNEGNKPSVRHCFYAKFFQGGWNLSLPSQINYAASPGEQLGLVSQRKLF